MSTFDAINLRPGPITGCQICLSSHLEFILDLGHNALCDSPLTPEQVRGPETLYPLRLVRCMDCGLVQIDYSVDPALLFHPDYPYLSGITETLKRNLQATAERGQEKFPASRDALAVDIGSNDGTLLEGFKKLGFRVRGVEATNIARVANEKGIPTTQGFFNLNMAQRIVDTEGAAAFVTATNVFAHVNHLGTLLRGIHMLLTENGVFISESHYLLDILATLQYDSIYHEHLRFYSLKPLAKLFDSQGFSLVDAERIPNYGGSIRIYAQKGRGRPFSENVRNLLAEEEKAGLYASGAYQKFARDAQTSRQKLRSLLVRLRDEGKTVAGIGCPGRAATLLTWCGISPDLLPYIAEQSTCLKVGKFTPGTHIPIVDEKRLFDEQPEYALILSWHYARDIVRKMRAKGLRSKIIVPLPSVRVAEGEL
ncbi:MAG: class I SAM-dependent methyltransferase [Verrucomicrobiae bacterium]|nr:class I SAM-dependent methyltransferase [Verrucomicrobiae bacterium]